MRQVIRQKNFQRLRLVSVLDLPSGRGPFPAVIICHGFKGNKDVVWLQAIARSLVKRGIAALRIDFPNNPKPNQSGGKFLNLTFGQEMRDLGQLYTWLKRHPKIDPNRIGLVGHSLGGKLVLHFAAAHPAAAVVDLAGVVDDLFYRKRFRKLVGKQGGGVYRRGSVLIERGDGSLLPLKLGFFRDIARWKTQPRLRDITAPTLILHGTADRSVPVSDSRLAMKLLRCPKRLVLLPDFPHNYKTAAQASRVAKLTTSWFAQHLL